MLRLNRPQRAVLTEKLPDVANLGVGALLFGQFVGDRPFSALLAVAGFAIWIGLMAITLTIARGDRR